MDNRMVPLANFADVIPYENPLTEPLGILSDQTGAELPKYAHGKAHYNRSHHHTLLPHAPTLPYLLSLLINLSLRLNLLLLLSLLINLSLRNNLQLLTMGPLSLVLLSRVQTQPA